MKRRPYIKLKAVFLLTVFMFSTVVGFACSVGLNLKFNQSHHTEEKNVLSHEHAAAHHKAEKAVSGHTHGSSRAHDHALADQHKGKKTKDDCCSDEVMKFARVDKRTPQSPEFSLQPVFFVLLFTGTSHFDAPEVNKLVSGSKYFARSYHPPIPEIRIAIQSFQI